MFFMDSGNLQEKSNILEKKLSGYNKTTTIKTNLYSTMKSDI